MPNNDKSIGSRPTGRFDKDSGVHREDPSIGDIPTAFVEEQKSIHLEPSKVVGERFEILEKLGSGSMGAPAGYIHGQRFCDARANEGPYGGQRKVHATFNLQIYSTIN